MKIVEVYKTVDGKLFENEQKARQHELDCIGELFDGILQEAVLSTGGNVTRSDQYRMCVHLLENRGKVKCLIDKLSEFLENE